MNKAYIGKICPYCKCEITADDTIVKCSICDMPHHRDCWIENQGCTTFGCDGTIQSIESSPDNVDFEIEVYYDNDCQAEYSHTHLHCSYCGSRIETGAAFCSKCGRRIGNKQEKTFCIKCGNELEADMQFCPKCGSGVINSQNCKNYTPFLKQSSYSNYSQNTAMALETADIQNNKGISVLCYFGLLLFIPLLLRPNSQFVKFHANQGLICLITGLVLSAICIIPFIKIIGWIMEIVLLVWEIQGIINCLKGNMNEVPIIGKYRIIK